jgi:hypothetical protein
MGRPRNFVNFWGRPSTAVQFYTANCSLSANSRCGNREDAVLQIVCPNDEAHGPDEIYYKRVRFCSRDSHSKYLSTSVVWIDENFRTTRKRKQSRSHLDIQIGDWFRERHGKGSVIAVGEVPSGAFGTISYSAFVVNY